MLLKSVLFSLFIISFNACKSNNIKNEIPKWYLNTPNNNSDFIYGSSVSYSLQEAKLQALSDMSNKLIVQIDSSFTSKTNVSKNFYEKQSTKTIKQLSKKIVFNNYKTLKVKNINSNYYVLLQVDKKELFDIYYKRFSILNKSINLQYNSSKEKSKFQRIYILNSFAKDINRSKDLLFILNAIDINFNISPYLEFYSKIKNQLIFLKNNLKINIQGSSDLYLNQIKYFLNKNNYKIYKNKYDISIDFTNNIVYSKAYSWNIVKITTNINIINNNKIIYSNIIKSIGRSYSSYDSAIISASSNFYKKLEDLGLNKFLFNR